MDPHLIQSIVILLLIASMVLTVAQWLKQPYSIILVLAGLVIAITHLMPMIHISHDVTFTLILPPLLFRGAMYMDLAQLKDNWKLIAMLAIPGVVCSTVLIGAVIHQIWGIEFLYALLFGALITPTDPVSVLTILKRVGAPEKLRTILEGESLFNDGTGVVLFSVILGILTGHAHFGFGDTILKFFFVTGGGVAIGIIVGFVAYQIFKGIDDHLHEVALTVVLVFGTPLLAEALHCSGIIAVVVTGLIMGNYGRVCFMSEKTREALEIFWDVINFLLNSLVFLIIGIELQELSKSDLFSFGPIIGLGVVVVFVSRMIVVYPIVKIHNCFNKEKILPSWAHILLWGGLKGAIPIALVVGLPHDFAYRNLFLTAAFVIVLFSLVIQGLSMRPLVKRLGLATDGR